MSLEKLQPNPISPADPRWIQHLGDKLTPITEKTESSPVIEIVPIEPKASNGNAPILSAEAEPMPTPVKGIFEPEKAPRRARKATASAAPTPIMPNDGMAAFAAWIESIARGGVDENKVREIVKEHLLEIAPRKIEVVTKDSAVIVEGIAHYMFELVLKAIGAGVNLALSGSTATSKTTMAVQAAKALGLGYVVQPVNEGTTKADILGYCTATGDYVPSLLYRAMKDGLLHIVEEIDSGSPASLLAFNNAIDNRELTFPNGETVQAHEKFAVVCTMNTKGTGSDRKFVGRNRLDAATLDRFVMLEVQRDLAIEAAIIGVREDQQRLNIKAGGIPTDIDWLNYVREQRAKYEKSHPDKIVSMRAVRDGWKLINQGIGLSWVSKMAIEK